MLARLEPPLQRLDGAGLVKVQHRVELVRQAGAEVMAEPLRLRSIHHANGPFEARLAQAQHQALGCAAQLQVAARQVHRVEQRLIAVRERRPHGLALGRLVPVRGGGHRARIRAEAHQHRILAVALAHQLANVPLALLADFGGACVAQMGVVRPHHDLRRPPLTAQVLGERLEGARRVLVAQVQDETRLRNIVR